LSASISAVKFFSSASCAAFLMIFS
jgi:hypothetical protein